MKTFRQQYTSNEISHREYYAKVLELSGIDFRWREDAQGIIADASRSTDPSYNDIQLSRWDTAALNFRAMLSKGFEDCGDFWSLGGGVCAIKEAVRQAVEAQYAKN